MPCLFKRRVEPRAGAVFKDAAEGFRNPCSHRLSAHSVIGIRSGIPGAICFGIKQNQAHVDAAIKR
jgi:hypothetical protein